MSSRSGLGGFVGTSVKRVEDQRLLTGRGTYLADVRVEGCLDAAFLRSPYPHAEIASIDVAAACALSGVHAVFTGADIERLTNPFLPFSMMTNLYTPLHYALSKDRVRMVGDPVAIVVAESRYIAEDALDLIEVDYEELPPVGTIATALDPTSTPLWKRAGGNVLYDDNAEHGDVDEVFTRADHVFTETFSCPRQSNQPMETRGTLVEVDAGTGELTVHSATQSSHMLRWLLAAYTERRSVLDSAKSFARNKQRRAGLLAGARSFLSESADDLKKQDNSGMFAQVRKEPSTLPHMFRTALGVAGKERFPTVVAKDIGGGFGAKGAVAREDVALAAAAIELGRSVRWVEDRVENLLDGGHAREEEMTLSMAVDDDGTIRGLKVDVVLDQGAYPSTPVAGAMIMQMMRVMWPGSYRMEAFAQRSRIVATNKGKYVAYRGPWANETWTRERMVNVVARRLGMSQAEIRLKNIMGAEDFPTAMVTGPTVDETMSTRKTLERALELADLDSFERAKADAAAEGRYLGVGIANYPEAAPGPPNYWDSLSPGSGVFLRQTARATVARDGSVEVRTPQMPHGQSHETTYAQIAADELGVGIEDVTVVYGDTSRTPFDLLGTGGSRGGPVGGGAVRKAGRSLRGEILDAAADLLEASVDDLEIKNGSVHVSGVPARGVALADVAASVVGDDAAADSLAFDVSESYTSAGDGGWSTATHVCWVDVDLDTGQVTIPRYLVVEDCGPVINPAIVDGQVRGGVAQGVGAVLFERVAYDDDGGMRSTTYLDYEMPTSMEVPDIEIEHLETLSPGENDFRGVGEGGMIGAPAAITNAIEDALSEFDVTVREQYLPPSRILELAGVITPD
ncbi:MAG: xanthine dehydrogenase family protein molybdopterin-binding subunit [Acidimicrobiia bacterium]|nr:xanthine dehydrogenase family protein molybdopterin-binding subunit [Acidimicrobiia bacterium]